jgi:hypothetical protein
VHYLLEGKEWEAADVLASCSIELGAVRYVRGSVSELDVTLRCPRHVLERLRSKDNGYGWNEDPQLLKQLRHAVGLSLPSGLGIANFDPRTSRAQPQSPLLLTDEPQFDVFISHASEDKEGFVRPLAKAMAALGLRVWFDEWTLTLGDRLRKKIDDGLSSSRYGVVVLSPDFFGKEWPRAELDALWSLEMEGRKVILPVYHLLSLAEIRRNSPMLAGKLGTFSEKGIDVVAAEVYAAVRSNG